MSYVNDRIPEGPWSVHVLKIARSRKDYELHTTMARSGMLGLSTLSEQIKTLPPELGTPVAAINGDFWSPGRQYEGDPMGLHLLRGELTSAPAGRSALWIDGAGDLHATNVFAQFRVAWPNGQTTPFGLNEERSSSAAVLYTPVVGANTRTRGGRELVLERNGTNSWLPLRPDCTLSARVAAVREGGNSPLNASQLVLSLGPQIAEQTPQVTPGAVLTIVTDLSPSLCGVKTALGGGPMLLRNGQPLAFNGAQSRHPRTAIGWNDKYLFLVEVDGRQRTLSVGMTFPELASYLLKLGCTDALNLDGGASSTIWVHGQVMNSPCAGRERPMANALVLVQKPKSSAGASVGPGASPGR